MVRKMTLLMAGGVLVVGGICGCPMPGAPTDGAGGMVTSPVRDASAGSATFAANCAVCHGADATGVVGPNIQGVDEALITDHVINSHEGHTVFDFTEQDIRDIAAFLGGF